MDSALTTWILGGIGLAFLAAIPLPRPLRGLLAGLVAGYVFAGQFLFRSRADFAGIAAIVVTGGPALVGLAAGALPRPRFASRGGAAMSDGGLACGIALALALFFVVTRLSAGVAAFLAAPQTLAACYVAGLVLGGPFGSRPSSPASSPGRGRSPDQPFSASARA